MPASFIAGHDIKQVLAAWDTYKESLKAASTPGNAMN